MLIPSDMLYALREFAKLVLGIHIGYWHPEKTDSEEYGRFMWGGKFFQIRSPNGGAWGDAIQLELWCSDEAKLREVEAMWSAYLTATITENTEESHDE